MQKLPKESRFYGQKKKSIARNEEGHSVIKVFIHQEDEAVWYLCVLAHTASPRVRRRRKHRQSYKEAETNLQMSARHVYR